MWTDKALVTTFVRASTGDLRVDFNKNIARHAITSYDLAVGQLQRFPCKI